MCKNYMYIKAVNNEEHESAGLWAPRSLSPGREGTLTKI